jgi:hypothetical protein
MAARVFLPDVARTRRGIGWVLIVLFGLPLIGLIAKSVESGRINGGIVFLDLLCGGLLALGLRLAFWPQEYFEVDPETGQFTLFRKGERANSGALNALGPLEVQRRTRTVGTDEDQRTVTEYVVRAAVHSDIDLYVLKTPGKARQKMERLAREWHLSCRSWGGEVRKADQLDTPLHERLRGDGAAQKAVSLEPAWKVSVSPAPMGYAVTSTHRSYTPLYTPIALIAVGAFTVGRVATDTSFLADLAKSAGDGDPFPVVLGGLATLGGAFLAAQVWVGVRDTFFPGTVLINDGGVSYRGRRIRYKHIEEVTSATRVEIVGDGRILALADTFCPPAASEAVAHELTRLIIEVAQSHEI